MPRKFTVTEPTNIRVELRRAYRECLQADQLAEYAHMRLSDVEIALKFSKDQKLTPDGEKALERLERATNALSDVRQNLGDAAYQVEQALKLAGEET
jgi:methylphosphotriester-DNA--protein-cysteine methyltransferase